MENVNDTRIAGMKKRQDLNERRALIYSLRKEGKTLAQIAEEYGLSKERVRSLCAEARFDEEILPTLPLLRQKLSARSCQGLSRYFSGDDIFSHPERIVVFGRKGLLGIKNIGEQSVDEISAALEELGCIKDIAKWYGPAYRGKDRGMRHMADTWITDIRHFLNEKGELPKKMSGHARSLAMYFGKIIEAASKEGNFGNEARTDIPCRKKPGNRKCGAAITASVQADLIIQWRCPACGDSGIISGWHDTVWDMRRPELPLTIAEEKRAEPKIDGREAVVDETLASILVQAIDLAADAVEIEHTGGGLEAMFLKGFDGVKSEITDSRRQKRLIKAIVTSAGLGKKSRGSFEWTYSGKTYEIVAQVYDILGEAAYRLKIRLPKLKPRGANQASRNYQLKITLSGSEPAIWRRIVVDSGGSLYELHDVIQAAMGWTNSHLHLFKLKKVYYHEPWEDDGLDEDFLDENEYSLNQVLTRPKTKMIYEYDFGDSWEHEVLVEKILEKDPKMKTPVCLEGAMACPPEDCGGLSGYYDYLAAIKNPKHPQHKEILEWMGKKFDPEKFELKIINKTLKRF